MLVSVLIPVYNVEDYIVRCARSLFEQTYEDCEFIFVDDGSPDSSISRLESLIEGSYSHMASRVHIVHHSRNRGLAEARNTAMESASGDFLLFVDSDDWCSPKLVAKLVSEQRKSDADIVSCDFFHVCAGRETRVHTHWVGGRDGSMKVVLAQSFALPNRVWAMLIRNSLVHNNGIRSDGSVAYGEDAVLLVKLLYYARTISHVDRSLYYYRIDSANSYSNNITRSSCRSYIRAQLLIWNFIRERDTTMKYTATLLLGRINLKRWLMMRYKRRSIKTLALRFVCYILNKLQTFRSWSQES